MIINTKSIATFVAALPLLVLLGCSNPADNVPAADVKSPSSTNTAETPKPSGTARTYAFGTNSSTIQFVGSKVTGSHEGGFHNFAGEFKVENGRVAGAGNKIVIDTASLWSDNQRLTGHLKNPDFFDVAKYPTATFVSTSVGPSGQEWTVTGNLTLHGITKQISFPAQIQVTDEAVTVKAEFSINRFDFEMKYPGKADDLIRKEVVIKLNVRAIPGSANFEVIEKKSAGPAA